MVTLDRLVNVLGSYGVRLCNSVHCSWPGYAATTGMQSTTASFGEAPARLPPID